MNLVINHLVEAFKHLTPSSEPFFRDSAVKALAIGVKGVKLVYLFDRTLYSGWSFFKGVVDVWFIRAGSVSPVMHIVRFFKVKE